MYGVITYGKWGFCRGVKVLNAAKCACLPYVTSFVSFYLQPGIGL